MKKQGKCSLNNMWLISASKSEVICASKAGTACVRKVERSHSCKTISDKQSSFCQQLNIWQSGVCPDFFVLEGIGLLVTWTFVCAEERMNILHE